MHQARRPLRWSTLPPAASPTPGPLAARSVPSLVLLVFVLLVLLVLVVVAVVMVHMHALLPDDAPLPLRWRWRRRPPHPDLDSGHRNVQVHLDDGAAILGWRAHGDDRTRRAPGAVHRVDAHQTRAPSLVLLGILARVVVDVLLLHELLARRRLVGMIVR